MYKFISKPNVRRGASIMIALIIFLICALLGASAFMMAATNVGRYAHLDDQQYYSVSSAALMIVDMLDDLTFTSGTGDTASHPITYTYERNWNYTGGAHQETDSYKLTIPKGHLGNLAHASTLRNGLKGLETIILAQCDKLVPYLNVPEEWYEKIKGQPGALTRPTPVQIPSVSYEFTVKVQDSKGQEDSKYGTVNCKFVMNANYDILLTFNGGDKEYAITVYWVADVSTTIATDNPKYVYADGEAVDENDHYLKGSMTQLRTLNVTVKWDKKNVTISRGEAINA